MKASDMRRKYQFAVVTDEDVVAKVVKYLEVLWRDSKWVDLFEEVS